MLQRAANSALAMGAAALAWLQLLPAFMQACASAQVAELAVAAMYQVLQDGPATRPACSVSDLRNFRLSGWSKD